MKRLEVTPGCIAALCLLRLLAEPETFRAFLAAAAAHEAGHLTALWLLGGRACALRFGFCDVQICAPWLSYRQEILCALAGPAASVLLCLALRSVFPTCAAISLLLGLFNALPVYPLDGGRALRAALRLCLPLGRAERICRAAENFICAAGSAGAVLCARAYDLGAAPVVVWGAVLVRLAWYRREEGLDSAAAVRYNK